MVCPPVCADNPQALDCGLSLMYRLTTMVLHRIVILYHLPVSVCTLQYLNIQDIVCAKFKLERVV